MRFPTKWMMTAWVTALAAAGAASTTNSVADDAEAQYTRVIEARAADVVQALGMTNRAAADRVRETLLTQYRALRTWHDANDARLKELQKQAAGTNQSSAAEAKQSMAALKQTLHPVHDTFLRKLASELSPEQVETVKDKMTYNKVRVTYDAYCAMLPSLTPEQKARVLSVLKEAREEAMDAGSSEEKSAVFNRYKGRINNYLSAQGYDLGKASRDWAQKAKAAARPKPATQP